MCGSSMFDILESEEVDEDEILGGRQLAFVLLFGILLFFMLTIFYEVAMPVINNPNYPFYNHVPDYTYIR
uniref:FXYD domain-containing ion transport regulator n=1 Tax=Parastrongyloides trichosuri TaxID=131310 RepID=A0A0N4ZN02_PARTI